MESCVCFGHSLESYEKYRDILREIIVELIENHDVSQFYSGGRGAFDNIFASVVGELRKIYPHIKNTLVYSYIPTGEERVLPDKYTDSVYLLDKYVPKKVAILKTNEMMIEKCKYVLSSVWYSWGGASKAIKYAKRKKKVILDLGYYIEIDKKKNKTLDDYIQISDIANTIIVYLKINKKIEEIEKAKQ